MIKVYSNQAGLIADKLQEKHVVSALINGHILLVDTKHRDTLSEISPTNVIPFDDLLEIFIVFIFKQANDRVCNILTTMLDKTVTFKSGQWHIGNHIKTHPTTQDKLSKLLMTSGYGDIEWLSLALCEHAHITTCHDSDYGNLIYVGKTTTLQ